MSAETGAPEGQEKGSLPFPAPLPDGESGEVQEGERLLMGSQGQGPRERMRGGSNRERSERQHERS